MIYLIAALLLIFTWLAIDHALFKRPEGGYYQKSYSCSVCKDTGWARKISYDVYYGKHKLGTTPSIKGLMRFQPCSMHLGMGPLAVTKYVDYG